MKRPSPLFVFLLAIIITGCNALGDKNIPTHQIEASQAQSNSSGMMGRSMGPGSEMMSRHHTKVPSEFAGLTNPIPADVDSLERGAEIYITHCATCHGDFGNGDGPGGANLEPAPAPIAHTSQMMGDAYLFWHITEGGIPFETAMIPYRDILSEQERWDVINYVRALASGQIQPKPEIGGVPFDPAQEQVNRLEMLMQAVKQGLITQDEANMFDGVHTMIDEYLVTNETSGMNTGPRADALAQILDSMVLEQLLTQEQANLFLVVHDRLIEAGLMQ
jgi:mono/diheme cytochrome c family protein